MNLPIERIINGFKRRRSIVVGIIVLMLAVNSFFMVAHISYSHKNKWDFYYEPGYQFNNFRPKLKGIRSVGYITNKDMSRENNDGAFLQAQYFLAPTVLRLDEVDEDLNILDYWETTFIIYQMRALKSKRIASNNYGQALVQKR